MEMRWVVSSTQPVQRSDISRVACSQRDSLERWLSELLYSKRVSSEEEVAAVYSLTEGDR